MLSYILAYIIVLLLIPFFDVFLKNVKNILNGRKTINLFQTYYDLNKLFKKENFKSQFTSFISIVIPIFILACSLLFLFVIPIINSSININIIVLFHILWLASFFLMVYALDNATYFGGLWSSREAFVLAIVEPITILLLFIFVAISNWNFDISSIHSMLSNTNDIFLILFDIILFITLFTILLAENKRFPFDNPSTHLELTMIHEAMLLETSWPKLAILEIASKINLIAFINIIIYLLWSNNYWFTSIGVLSLLYIVKVCILLLLIAIVEVFITKMRLFKYQNIFSLLLFLQIIFIVFYLFK